MNVTKVIKNEDMESWVLEILNKALRQRDIETVKFGTLEEICFSVNDNTAFIKVQVYHSKKSELADEESIGFKNFVEMFEKSERKI